MKTHDGGMGRSKNMTYECTHCNGKVVPQEEKYRRLR